MKDGGQRPGWQSCLLQIEQRTCVNFAILGGSPSSGVLGTPPPRPWLSRYMYWLC